MAHSNRVGKCVCAYPSYLYGQLWSLIFFLAFLAIFVSSLVCSTSMMHTIDAPVRTRRFSALPVCQVFFYQQTGLTVFT